MGTQEEARDRLSALWEIQRVQQSELGLDPSGMDAIERRRTEADLTRQLQEEACELGRLNPSYKRHLLRTPAPSRASVAEECADVLKMTFAIAQLHGVTLDEMYAAFIDKTLVVSQRARHERAALESDQPLLGVDLDDVVFDLAPFRDTLIHDESTDAALRLMANERAKAEFYQGGRFRELEPIPGAPEAIRAIKEAGWRVVGVTARPQWQYKHIYSDTIFSLEKHDIPLDLVLFNKDKVEALYEHVCPAWPAFFVEDMERNAKALAAAGVHVLLYDQPHNQTVSSTGLITRVKDWRQIMSLLGIGPTAEAAE